MAWAATEKDTKEQKTRKRPGFTKTETVLQIVCSESYLAFNLQGQIQKLGNAHISRRGGEKLFEWGCGDTVDEQRKSPGRRKGSV